MKHKKQRREGIERSVRDTLTSLCHFFLFKINRHTWKVANLPPKRIMEDMRARVSQVAPVRLLPENGPEQQPSGKDARRVVPAAAVLMDSESPMQTHSQTASGAAQNPSKQTCAACCICARRRLSQEPADRDREASPRVWRGVPVANVCSLRRTSITVSGNIVVVDAEFRLR